MSALGVRRDNAAFSSGCKSHPANAPAGSSRSSYGDDERAEAFGMRIGHQCVAALISDRPTRASKTWIRSSPPAIVRHTSSRGAVTSPRDPAVCPYVGINRPIVTRFLPCSIRQPFLISRSVNSSAIQIVRSAKRIRRETIWRWAR